MQCPQCNAATHVLETRQTRRRRQCLSCGHRFSTVEVLADDVEAPRPVARPKPVPVQKPAMTVKERGQARTAARRKIEDRGYSSSGDWFSEDNDYLPEG